MEPIGTMSTGFDSAARELENFFLGAVMQQDPFLEEFSTLPDEPPDAEPCHADQSVARSEPLEQGTLFDLPDPDLPKPKSVYRPKAILGYADYKRIFRGDVNLAVYWFNKTSGNVVARKK